MDTKDRSGLSVSADQFEVSVEIFLETLKSTRTEVLLFFSQPITFEEIKIKVEECCSIPTCVQKMLYQKNEIIDSCTTESLYLRSGDTIQVFCPGKSNVKEVKVVVQWLKDSIQILRHLSQKFNRRRDATSFISAESLRVLTNPIPSRYISKVIFSSWSDPASRMNCHHFDFLGGVQLLIEFHELVIQLRQQRLHRFERYFLYLERLCCEAVSKYSMNDHFSRRMACAGGLDSCISSFLLKPADDKSLLKHHGFNVLEMAMDALYNIAEIPDVQYDLTLRNDVIQQVLLLASSPMSSFYDTIGCASFLVCLSRCKNGHSNLFSTDVVDKLIGICSASKDVQNKSTNKSGVMVLKSYVGVIFAQLISGSSDNLMNFPIELLIKMLNLMEEASDVDPLKVQEYERNHGIVWGTFLPCIQYLYEPHMVELDVSYDNPSQAMIESLRCRSIDVLLQHLENSLGRKEHVDVLLAEHILDFIILLPCVLPEKFLEKTRSVHSEIAKFHQIQPPLLTSISKAILAKSMWGLPRLLDIHLISDLYSDSVLTH